jgi:peptidyl-prolyl cis-trans isomerase C
LHLLLAAKLHQILEPKVSEKMNMHLHVTLLLHVLRQSPAKPFYLRDIQIGDVKLPITPVTLVTMLISFFFIIRGAGGSKSTVTASHILLDGDKAKDKLDTMKKEIKQDYNKFTAFAKQHSKCPSGKAAGGKLGTFRPGQMVPPFDKAVFDKENKVGTCIGPIQTNFGWHLIWIEDRNLVE